MSPGGFYIDKTKKKNTYTKNSIILKIYGDIDKAKNSQKRQKKIFFLCHLEDFISTRQKQNNYTKISSMIKVYGDIDTAKKRPEKDNTLYKYMWISRKQKPAKKMTIHFTFKLDPL